MTTTVWNGTTWLGKNPTVTVAGSDLEVEIRGNYNTTTHGSIECGNLHLISGSLTIGIDTYVRVHKFVEQASGFIFNINSGQFALYNPTVDTTGIKVTIKRIFKNDFQRLDYYLIGDPISGKIAQTLSPETVPSRFYVYNTLTDKYNANITGNIYSENPNTSVSLSVVRAGIGMLVRNSNNFPTIPSKWEIMSNSLTEGKLNSGEIKIPFELRTDTMNSYLCISNPYSACIDLRKFYCKNKFIKQNIYRYLKTNNSTPEYAVRENFYSSTINPDKSIYLEPFEGIIITIPKDTTQNEIIFTPDMMRLGTNYTEPDAITFSLKVNEFNLPIGRATYEINNYTREFSNEIFNDGPFQFLINDIGYVLYDDEVSLKPSLNLEHISDKEIHIKLIPHIIGGVGSTSSINLDKVKGRFLNNDITLVDTVLNINTLLTLNGTSSYEYNLGTQSVPNTERFKLLITKKIEE